MIVGQKMSGIITENTITILTESGKNEIDLCFGDITKLKKEDEVDVLMVSAFRGDYSPTPLSLIGALDNHLKLSVEDLAKDKEEDLRKLYSCWWSKPLPAKYSYGRVLCFEHRKLMRGHPAELVGDVFRCLVSILRNQDGRVITPLLTTGDQGFPKKIMLQSMVEGAVNWIKAGLPLRKLKIVLFANVEGTNQVQQAKKRFEDISQIFSELKQKYEGQQFMPEEVPIQYDVYLSYSEKDSESAMKLKESLQKMKKDIKIFLEQQELVADEVWQDTIYQVMLTCAKVVAVLSPAYLASSRCMEQYNIALCCNRKTKRDMLAPFYIENITVMPTYMGLVQYVDCRPHAVEKIEAGCQHLIDSLSTSLSSTSSNQRTLISQHSQ
ncbi:uncharacterized protein [Ptychodera flava]